MILRRGYGTTWCPVGQHVQHLVNRVCTRVGRHSRVEAALREKLRRQGSPSWKCFRSWPRPMSCRALL